MHDKIIKTLLEPDNFKQYGSLVNKQTFGDDRAAYKAFRCISSWFEDHDKALSVEELETLHRGVLGPTVHKRDLEDTELFYEGLRSCEATESAEFYLQTIKRQNLLLDAGTELINLAQETDSEKVSALLDGLRDKLEVQAATEMEGLPSVEEFCKTLDAVHKWDMPFPELNERVQGFGPGRTMLIFALSNVGKSSFCVSLINGFLQQGARVLDVSITEDPLSRRIPRLLQAMNHMSYTDIEARKAELYEGFLEQYGDQYLFRYDAGMTASKLRKLAETFQPDIMVVDNFSKLQRTGRKELNHAKTLGLNLADLKGIGEEYQCGVIPVCQASDTARGKRVLTMADIADSKVDVPGELEIALGIAPAEAGAPQRHFNLAKNKLGPEETFILPFNAELCKWG